MPVHLNIMETIAMEIKTIAVVQNYVQLYYTLHDHDNNGDTH